MAERSVKENQALGSRGKRDGGSEAPAEEGRGARRAGMAAAALGPAAAGAIVAWCLSAESPELRRQLMTATPWFLEIAFCVVLAGLALSASAVRGMLRGVSRREAMAVGAVALAGMFMAAFAAPRVHRLYYDENIYLNIGQTMAAEKKAAMCGEGYNQFGEYRCAQPEHNKQPYGFPHLLSLVFRLAGPSELAGFLLNNLIFGLSLVVTFFLGLHLFESTRAGLYGMLLYCLIPENILWANTTAAEPSTALFTGLVIAAGLVYLKVRSVPSLLLLAGVSAYGVHFRTESFLILVVLLLLFVLFDHRVLKDRYLYLFGAVALVLAAHHGVHIFAVRGENWGSAGPRMSLEYFRQNFTTNTLFYLRNERFPVLFTLLAGLGLFLGGKVRPKAVLAAWFLAFWGIFLVFYAGSYEYGQDIRFSLMSFQPLALLAGAGLWRLEDLAARRGRRRYFLVPALIVLAVTFSSFLPYVRTEGREANQARFDHRYAMEMAELLPEDSMVLTHNPNMFLLWGKNAAQASIATGNPALMDHFLTTFRGGVYFHFNFWCNVDNPSQQQFCRNILDTYDHESLAKHYGGNYEFALYKLTKKDPPPGPARDGTLRE